MIIKYKKFENMNIRYISNGFDNCPVCGYNDYSSEIEFDYRTCTCDRCDFNWYQNTEDIFENAYTDDGHIIIKGDKYKDIYFKSNGRASCPYCHSENYDIIKSDFDEFELTEYLKCNDCKSKWIKYYYNTVISTQDFNYNEIKIGNIVDTKLFNLKKYRNIRVNRYNL